MGFFNKIASLYNRVISSMQDARDLAVNLPAKIVAKLRVIQNNF